MALRDIFFQKGTGGGSKFLALVLVGVLLLHGASGPAHHFTPNPDTANHSEHHSHPTHPVEEASAPSDAARGKDASQPGVGYLAILLILLASWLGVTHGYRGAGSWSPGFTPTLPRALLLPKPEVSVLQVFRL